MQYEDKALSKIDWGSGLWQKVQQVQASRKDFVHINISQDGLFAGTHAAEEAISILRDAIKEIYSHAGKPFPVWVNDDEDRGWDIGRKNFVSGMAIHAGANPDDPSSIKIVYVHKDREHVSHVLPPGTNPEPYMIELLNNLNIPVTAIRAYRGSELLAENKYHMRGL